MAPPVIRFSAAACLVLSVTLANAQQRPEPQQIQQQAIQALVDGDVGAVFERAKKLADVARSAPNAQKPIYFVTAQMLLLSLQREDLAGIVADVHRNFIDKRSDAQIDHPLVADVLRQIAATQKVDPMFHSRMQMLLMQQAIAAIRAQLAPTQPIPMQAAQLEKLLSEQVAAWTEAGVPPDVAKLLNVGNVLFAEEFQSDPQWNVWLQRLRPMVDSPEVGFGWKAFLTNKQTAAYLSQRRYAEAFEECERFHGFAQLAGDAAAQVTCVEQLALIYLRMGDYPSARDLYQLTESIERQQMRVEPLRLWLTNMAKALEGAREYAAARRLLEEAVQKKSSEDSFSMAMAINNLAINAYLTGDLMAAQEHLQESREMLQRIAANPLQLAESSINAGWFSLADEKPSDARSHFKRAQQLLQQHLATAEQHPRYAEALACEARAALLMNAPDEARGLLHRAEELAFSKLVEDLAATGASRDRLALLQESRVHPESVAWPGVFDTLIDLSDDLGIPADEQLKVIFKWKGILNRFQHRAAGPLAEEAQALHARLRELYFRPVSRLKRDSLLEEIALVEDSLRFLERRMARENAVDAQSFRFPEPEDLAKRLNASSYFIEILQFRKYQPPRAQGAVGASGEYLAYVVNSQGQVQRVLLGEADAVDAAIEKWIKQLQEDSPQVSESSKEVASLLQRPLLPCLQDAESLSIRADGMCHVLPWGALPGIAGKTYWIENQAIQTLHDIVPNRAPSPTTTPQLLLVGGVDYGRLSSSWEALPGTLPEAESIAQEFAAAFPSGSANLLTGKEANEVVVLDKMQPSRFVHLATHGFYLKQDNNPFGLTAPTTLLGSGLILAEVPSQSPGNQQLTAAEIREVDLKQTELVVLSACETGLGKIKAGQGVDGLTSCFHAAGAKYVVSSLWKVPDNETTELMTRFYTALWRDELSPPRALRQAQLHMLSDPCLPAAAKQPASWAAFSTSNAGLGEASTAEPD